MRASFGTPLLLTGAALLLGAGVWFFSAGRGVPTRSSHESQPDDAVESAGNVARASSSARTASVPTAPNIAGTGSLSGKVLVDFRDGAAPEEITVRLRPSQFVKGRETAIAREIAVDPRRHFLTAVLPYGAYQVQPMAAGFSGTPMEVRLDEARRHSDVVVRLVRNAEVTGFVRDATRAPVEQVVVSVFGKTESGERFAFETRTAADGSFRVPSIPNGLYSVNIGAATLPLRPPTPLTVRDGVAPTMILEVPQLCAIDVRILVLGIDLPLEAAFVTCVRTELDKGGEVESLMTNADGRVSFRNLLPGSYSIVATREYFRRMAGRARVVDGIAESVTLEAIPVLDELIQSLNPNPKPQDR